MRATLIVALLTCAPETLAHNTSRTDHPLAIGDAYDRLRVFNDCSDIQPTVKMSGDDLPTMATHVYEMTKAVIENRLRATGLYTKEGGTELVFSAQISRGSLHTDLSFHKPMADSYSEEVILLPTWRREFTQTYDDGMDIPYAAGVFIDKFMHDYLEVNEVPCRKKGVASAHYAHEDEMRRKAKAGELNAVEALLYTDD